MEPQTIQEMIGSHEQVAEELRAFSETAKLLSQPELYERYKGEWVALYDRRVRAHGASLDNIFQQIDEQGLPRRNTLIRFIDDGTKTLVLYAAG